MIKFLKQSLIGSALMVATAVRGGERGLAENIKSNTIGLNDAIKEIPETEEDHEFQEFMMECVTICKKLKNGKEESHEKIWKFDKIEIEKQEASDDAFVRSHLHWTNGLHGALHSINKFFSRIRDDKSIEEGMKRAK